MIALLLALLTLSLFGGMGGVTWKWLEANAHARQAEAEKQAALYQAYRASIAAASAALQDNDVADAAPSPRVSAAGPAGLGVAAPPKPARR